MKYLEQPKWGNNRMRGKKTNISKFLTVAFVRPSIIKQQFVVIPTIRQTDIHTIPSYSQRDTTFLDLFISTDALHVSGGSSAHHQEHITVHTASGIVNQYCC